MAKVSGIVSSLAVDDAAGTPQTISDDTTQLTISTPQNQQDTTGLDKTAIERLGLLMDATYTITGVADFAAGKEHDVFKANPAANAFRTVTAVLANSAATLSAECNLQDYGYTRGQDGSLIFTATLVNADGNPAQWS